MDKLHITLAKIDAGKPSATQLMQDYLRFFKKGQGAFRGEKGTYVQQPNTVDDPSKRGVTKVQTTVKEKIDYAIPLMAEHLNNLLNQESTNASGITGSLMIGENEIELSSLELLRIKNWIETSGIRELIENIPVRSDDEIWEESKDEMYSGREVLQSPLLESENKTTEKEEYILSDPNLSGLKDMQSSYVPLTAVRTTVVILGDVTFQKFTGEWSHRMRSDALTRLSDLRVAVIVALKECNDAEVVETTVAVKEVLEHVFYGK